MNYKLSSLLLCFLLFCQLSVLGVSERKLYLEFTDNSGLYDLNESALCLNIGELSFDWCSTHTVKQYLGYSRLFAVSIPVPRNWTLSFGAENLTSILHSNHVLSNKCNVSYVTTDRTYKFSIVYITILYSATILWLACVRRYVVE